MPNANDLVRLIKKAALDAVEAKKPVNIAYGKVTSVSPLRILVEQKMLLGANQIVLCRNVTKEGLGIGDEVILFRMQGGQKYIVVDRIG